MLNLFTKAFRNLRGITFLGRKARHISEIPMNVNRPYLVKGLILPKQVSVLAAAPNTGKSCIVGALLAHLVQGKPFAGHRVRRAAALYIGAEDPDGIAVRCNSDFATEEDKTNCEFMVYDRAIDMSKYDVPKRFIKEVKAFKKRITADRLIIVFDTLTLSIGTADENNAGDMTIVMANARELAQETGAHVMFVHHTSAADPRKARGSTALVGNPDTVFVLKPVSKNRVLTESVKQRSMPKGDDIGFEIEAIYYGRDDDGDIVTNPRAKWVEDTTDWAEPTGNAKGKKASNSKPNEVLRTLRELEAEAQADGSSMGFGTKEIADHVGDPFNREGVKPESLHKAVREALNTLVAEGHVARLGSQGYRTSPANSKSKDDQGEYATLH